MKNSWLPSVPVIGDAARPTTLCPCAVDEIRDLALRLLVQRRVRDDAAAPDILALQLELRFDQREDHTGWS